MKFLLNFVQLFSLPKICARQIIFLTIMKREGTSNLGWKCLLFIFGNIRSSWNIWPE